MASCHQSTSAICLLRVPEDKLNLYLIGKTRYSRRTINIGPDLVEMLTAHRQNQIVQKQFTGSKWQDCDLVFTNTIGNPLDQRNMQRDFDAMLMDAGLAKIRFHDLRHNAASMMLANSTSVVSVSRYLGHSSPQVTMEIYAHLVPGGFGDIVRAMNNLPLGQTIEIPAV